MIKEVLANRAYGTKSHRKLIVKFTDAINKEHIRIFIINDTDDINALLNKTATELEKQLKLDEQQTIISKLENATISINHFRDSNNNLITPNYNTLDELKSNVLLYFLKLQNPTAMLYVAHLLDNLTDAELITLLNIDQAKVDEIRIKAANIDSIKTNIDGYIPPL